MKKAFYETEVMFVKRQLRHIIKERDALKDSIGFAAHAILKLQGKSPHDKKEVGALTTSLINMGKKSQWRKNFKK